MARVSIYSPQLTVPVQPAVMTNPADARAPYDAIAQGSERLMAAYEQKKKEDTQLALANERISIDHELTMAHADDVENGRVGEGYVDTVKSRVDERYAAAQARFADNPDALAALGPIYGDINARFTEQAMQTQSQVVGAQKFDAFGQSVDMAANTVRTDPAQLARQQGTIDAAAAAFKNPAYALKAKELARSLPFRALQGMVNTDPGKAEALLKKQEFLSSLSPAQLEHITNEIDQSKRKADALTVANYNNQNELNKLSGKPLLTPDVPKVYTEEARAALVASNLADQKSLLTQNAPAARYNEAKALGMTHSLDPTNEKDRAAIEYGYYNDAEDPNSAITQQKSLESSLQSARPEDRQAIVQQYELQRAVTFGQMNFIPSQVAKELNAALTRTDASAEDAMRATVLLDNLRQVNGNIDFGENKISPAAIKMATTIQERLKDYVPTDQAVREARDQLKLEATTDKEETEARKQIYRSALTDGIKAGDPDRNAQFLATKSAPQGWGSWFRSGDVVSDRFRAAFEVQARREYMNAGATISLQQAQERAWAHVSTMFTPTGLTHLGETSLSEASPEKYYGVPGYTLEQNTAWIRKQAEEDAVRGSMKPEGGVEGKVQVYPAFMFTGVRPRDPKRPTYALVVDGQVQLGRDKSGFPVIREWVPDPQKILNKTAAEKATHLKELRDQAAREKLARERRARGEAPYDVPKDFHSPTNQF